MIPTEKYKTGQAFWRSIQDRAKAHAKAGGKNAEALQRHFVRERLLARVFEQEDVNWVLKGGNAVLARVADARATNDVDLLRRLGDLDEAYTQLIEATQRDLGDYFRFEPTRRTSAGQGADQPAIDGDRVTFDAYCGAKKVQELKVDLVVGSLMTDTPEEITRPVLEIEGLAPTTMRLYPIVDHVADKVCATQASYGSEGGRSTRVRDLVDLVIFARTQTIEGTALTHAIASEWALRGLRGTPTLDVPAAWSSTYGREARDVKAVGQYTDFASASELATGFVLPACGPDTAGLRWTPAELAWMKVD